MRRAGVLGLLMRTIERLLWICGCVMLSVFLGHLALAEYKRTQSVAAFKSQQLASIAAAVPNVAAERNFVSQPDVVSQSASLPVPQPGATSNPGGSVAVLDVAAEDPDQSLWSAGRIASYAASLAEETSEVVGIFAIPRLSLEVPLYESVSELHMDRGIAHIEGTAVPGQPGNMGIAGQRDGYFRVLKDIKFGDELIFTSAHGDQTFVVQQLMVVDPSAIEVLAPTDETTITLVTCYPFYYVGHAPERFIVRAVLQKPMKNM
jgi:sortase A